VALVTLYVNSLALLQQGLFEFLITLEGVVIAELALYEILKASEETELVIKMHGKKGKLGFSVESKNKTIKDAYPICNDFRYQWEDDDGSSHKVTDLYVGAKPSCFYPFKVEVNETVDSNNIFWLMQLTEIESKKRVYTTRISREGMATSLQEMKRQPPDILIRIVGEGNETKKDYELVRTLTSSPADMEAIITSGSGIPLNLIEKRRRRFGQFSRGR
jgi:hypothetical protein